MTINTAVFDLNCTACPRLSQFLLENKEKYPEYHARPVPPFGVAKPKLLIVGLAPGMHGANATGRPFTGDHAGIILYEMLYQHGFSNKPISLNIKDGLKLKHARITNAVKCLPPDNKPVGGEINTCNHFLVEELKTIDKKAVILCLGLISHKAVIKAFGLKQSDYPFIHGKAHKLDDGRQIIDSYHCSRYNTNTKRLTEKMFSDVFKQIRVELKL
ncbi:MAG TPA: uracil-DNA glycosylase [Thiotrichaceae bacterium]|jgi:uracil-DNA glycosylase family 4|nr:uracil-DNA glycosylase [Thiotrichaceae bacterium]HIM07096.1 uracil-DNA glycosylase [Gammaproteobacteria bacterium]